MNSFITYLTMLLSAVTMCGNPQTEVKTETVATEATYQEYSKEELQNANWNDGFIMVNDIVYKLPESLPKFGDNEWEIVWNVDRSAGPESNYFKILLSDPEANLPSDYELETTMKSISESNGSEMKVGLYNPEKTAIKTKDSKVCNIEISEKLSDKESNSMELAKGIKFGSTIDEVKETYGEPNNEQYFEFIDRTECHYEDDKGNTLDLCFSNGVLTSIKLNVK